MHLYETKDPAILSASTTGMVAETPNFLEVQSKMFNLTTEDNLAKYKNFPVGWDQRHHCITVDSFANMYLSDPDKYMVVTTSTADEEG